MNDEAHHAYRIRREEKDDDQLDIFGDDDEAENFFQEATVWVDGQYGHWRYAVAKRPEDVLRLLNEA